MFKTIKKQKTVLLSIAVGIVIYLIIPMQLFNDPYATVVFDKNGKLLSAKIADDGQWRFPEVDSIPIMLVKSIQYYEDEYFFIHPGFNPVSFLRAIKQNIKAGKTISGGSTISMQVIRLLRKNKPRTYYEKIIEIILAIKLEIHYSKNEILKLYVSHAPYGGNIVGAEAASFRYFSRPLHLLSAAEYATLAVLPNAPALVRPGKNRSTLIKKRNFLLKKLLKNQILDSLTYSLSIVENIPQKPQKLPDEAFHLLDFAIKSGKKGQRIKTTIKKPIQIQLLKKLDNYIKILSQNNIRNACAIVISIKNKEIIAYIGNTTNSASGARYVDILQCQRSSGSILKPFLYARAIDEGLIHTSTLMRDVPISINNFTPANFNKQFYGLVTAKDALTQSLNIPAALLLRDYGIMPFYNDLQDLGFTTINRTPENYGLTLILGGAEISMWDLAHIYANQAIRLNECVKTNPDYRAVKLWKNDTNTYFKENSNISIGSWWLVSEMLTEVQRPNIEAYWQRFSSSQKISWKTGTSFGFRDAWALGYNAEYLIGVWIGNAEGDGRPGLTGVSAAAPLMFQFFKYLKSNEVFEKPEFALKKIKLCQKSGLSANPFCVTKTVEMPIHAKLIKTCFYHKKILLNNNKQRVYINCFNGKVHDTVWFVIDPLAGLYYQKSSIDYKPIPDFSPECKSISENILDIIYPQNDAEIIIPKDFDRKEEKIVFEATHANKEKEIFWHLNSKYLGKTYYPHKFKTNLPVGNHVLLIIDEAGNSKKHQFRIYKNWDCNLNSVQ